MGRDTLGVMIQRKVSYSWQTGTSMLFNTYKYPIVAKNMAPAREACENCHKPEKFSADKLVEIKRFTEDEKNTPSSTFLVVKTGGGTQRQGLGYGIHWHIENPVYFYTTDREQQNIPYVVVTNKDGSKTEYVDVEAGFDPSTVKQSDLKEMDCITCHNRTAHLIDSPQNLVDDLMTRNLVSPKIPEIKKKAVEVLSASYPTTQAAMDGIASLVAYYQGKDVEAGAVDAAVKALQDTYQQTNFTDQKASWQTHPNNLEHKDSPGCFRCHDGKHLTKEGAASAAPSSSNPTSTIRLECNLCHSVPMVSAPNQLTASLQLNKGFEPESHTNPNWISLHRDVFNDTCKGCHKTDDPGGVSNTSFCSNSMCHGADWKFAGFDAPKLRTILSEQVKVMVPTPTATPEVTATPETASQPAAGQEGATPEATQASADSGSQPAAGAATYPSLAPIFESKCGSCHGSAAMKGLNLLTYADIMKGSEDGAVVTPGDPEKSLLVIVQSGDQPHFGQLSAEELALLKEWIKGGAAEK
jgi:mono/diheme cytochrome c family protein